MLRLKQNMMDFIKMALSRSDLSIQKGGQSNLKQISLKVYSREKITAFTIELVQHRILSYLKGGESR